MWPVTAELIKLVQYWTWVLVLTLLLYPIRTRSRPDGCGQLITGHPLIPFHTSQCGYPSQLKGDYHWFNIAYVEEYKKRDSRKDLNDVYPLCTLHLLFLLIDLQKILWSKLTSYDECPAAPHFCSSPKSLLTVPYVALLNHIYPECHLLPQKIRGVFFTWMLVNT